jgi:hypothetical protein
MTRHDDDMLNDRSCVGVEDMSLHKLISVEEIPA